MSPEEAEIVARQFVRAIRGRRSQGTLARRVRISTQTVANWEAGRRFPTTLEVLELCARLGLDPALALERFAPDLPPLSRDEGSLATWLRSIAGDTVHREIAARMKCSRDQISRLLSGKTQPKLPLFFAFVETMTARLSDLVGEIVPIDRVPVLAREHRRRVAARRLAFEEPWTEAVLRVLEIDDYRSLPRHHPGFIAAKLGLDLDTEQRLLAALCDAGIVEHMGGRFVQQRPFAVDTGTGSGALRDVRRHWLRVTAARLADARESDLFGYNVVSVSRRDLARIREMQIKHFYELRSLIAESNPPEVAALIGLQLIEW